MKKKQNIVMLISNNNPGGVYVSTSLLVKNTDREKFKIIVVACGNGPIAEKIGSMADEYHNLNVGTFPRLRKMKNGKYVESYGAWIKLFFWLLKCVCKFTFWLYKNDTDLIHSNGTHFNIIAGIASRLAFVPSVWHVRFPQNMGKSRNFLIRLAEGPIASLLPTKIIANSNFTMRTLHDSWRKKAVVVLNGIDVSSIVNNQKPEKLREMINVGADEKLVGVTGLISHRKGFDRFIQMASELHKEEPSVKFVIIGGAPQEMEQVVKKELESLTQELGLSENLFFTGNLDNASYYMGDMDVFFMCSRPGTETFGLVVIEAMAIGVPVVSFANDAIPEIIENEVTGFLVPEGDIKLVKDKIIKLITEPEFANKITKAAKERVLRDFDVSTLVSNVEKVYLDVLKKKES